MQGGTSLHHMQYPPRNSLLPPIRRERHLGLCARPRHCRRRYCQRCVHVKRQREARRETSGVLTPESCFTKAAGRYAFRGEESVQRNSQIYEAIGAGCRQLILRYASFWRKSTSALGNTLREISRSTAEKMSSNSKKLA